MLETREKGYSLGLLFRRSKWRYAFLAAFFGGMLGLLAFYGVWSCFWGVAGALLGVVFRDIGWMLQYGRTWPFSVKVVDWEKVEKYAKGELS
jgi:hypothetical protein